MSNWQIRRDALNRLPMRHETWEYRVMSRDSNAAHLRYATARTEFFEAAAVNPTGSMPEASSGPQAGPKGAAESEAVAQQNAKQTLADASGPEERGQKESPDIPGISLAEATLDDSAPTYQMGVEGSSPLRFYGVLSAFSVLCALCVRV